VKRKVIEIALRVLHGARNRGAVLLGLMLLVLLVLLTLAAGLVATVGHSSLGALPERLWRSLAGTEDMELVFEVAEPETNSSPLRDQALRALVMRRLSAAQVGADVTVSTGRVHVIVDAELEDRVAELLCWTGEPRVMVALPDAAPGMDPTGTLTLRSTRGARWYEGSRDDVVSALASLHAPEGSQLLAERIATDTDARQARYRTRAVNITRTVSRDLGVRFRGNHGGRIWLKADLTKVPADPELVLTRGIISLGPITRDPAGELFVDVGTGALAIHHAHREGLLLSSPRLPELRRIETTSLPTNLPLALGCLLVPIVLSIAWLAFVRRFDRAHPEPLPVVLLTFLLGAFAVIPAGLLEAALARISPWFDPRLLAPGSHAEGLVWSAASLTLVVGLSEELSKRAGAEAALRSRAFDEPIDGIVYGMVSSLGFAAAENIRYFALGRLNAPLVIARSFMSIPAHMFFGALWGYALGKKLIDSNTRPWRWLIAAAAAHGLFDALLALDGGRSLALVLNLGLSGVFVVLVRRALRHGVTTTLPSNSAPPGTRSYFRVGRPRVFWLSVVALHALALGIFWLGAFWQLGRYRPSTFFVFGSTLMLALLAVAAYAITWALPLDVVIDAHGVTFAGSHRAWESIRAIRMQNTCVELDTEEAPLVLGPAAPPVLAALADAIDQKRAAAAHRPSGREAAPSG
jgi:RsiW-degrading membrane proteinase PrsW (M82 family)